MERRERADTAGAVSGDGRLSGASAYAIRPGGNRHGVDRKGHFEEGVNWDVERVVICLFIKS